MKIVEFNVTDNNGISDNILNNGINDLENVIYSGNQNVENVAIIGKHYALRDYDEKFKQLQSAIDKKREYLLEKQKDFKKASKTNEFLADIRNDYLRYENYVVKQKYDQIRALQMLNKYISDLNETGELTKQNLLDSKHEQKKIIKEIKSISSSLDDMITDTSELSKLLRQNNGDNYSSFNNNDSSLSFRI